MITLNRVGLLVCGSRDIGEYGRTLSEDVLFDTRSPYMFYRNKDHVVYFDKCMRSVIELIVRTERRHNPEFTSSDIVIVQGGARGPDDMAHIWSRYHSMACLEVNALWDKHGKSAGYIRNADMENMCKYVFAAYDGQSKGTAHMIALAKKHKKKVKTVNFIDKFPYQFK